MKVRLNSIILFVRDVERLNHFYTKFLGLRLTEEINSEGVVLKAGPCELALHRIAADYSPDNENPVPNHSNTKIIFDIDEELFILQPTLAAHSIGQYTHQDLGQLSLLGLRGLRFQGNDFLSLE